jgi:hypothetical protein
LAAISSARTREPVFANIKDSHLGGKPGQARPVVSERIQNLRFKI